MTNPNRDKWYFTKEQLENTASRKCGFDAYRELSCRQRAADLIQSIGQKLKLSQLCTNTAIVYMHRFYVFHSFTRFPWHEMAAAALLLAAKVEEQARKVEHVVQVAYMCRHPGERKLDVHSEWFVAQCEDIVFNEHVLLQTLGFHVEVDHPHAHVVRCCHLVRASKEIAQSSYLMASNSLHLTTMCLQYKPTVVACFCILVACKLSKWKIPISKEKREWYSYVDPTVTPVLIQQLTEEFLVIFEAFPSKLKKIDISPCTSFSQTSSTASNSSCGSDPLSQKSSQESRADPENDPRKSRPQPHQTNSTNHHRHRHNLTPIDSRSKPHWWPSSIENSQSNNPSEPRDNLGKPSRRPLVGIAASKLRHTPKETRVRPSDVPHSDKEVLKRDYILKPITQTGVEGSSRYYDSPLGYKCRSRRDPPVFSSRERDFDVSCKPFKPIMIKIAKNKLRPLPESSVRGAKIDLGVPKEEVSFGEFSRAPCSIGILRDKINECSIAGCSKKRGRDEVSSLSDPPSKMAKTKYEETKENGRNSCKEEAVKTPP